MAKELNVNMTKYTHGKMYSKICSLKVTEELLDLTEVGILHIAVDDHITYVLFRSRYISNHTIDESMKGTRGISHSEWYDLILVKAI